MKCGGCGAEILLGAAACERCGWSPVGRPAPPPPDLGGSDPFSDIGSPTPPAPPPPAPPPTPTAAPSGFRPPPPPPAGYVPPARRDPRAAMASPTPADQRKGCGCLSFLVLLSVGIAAAGVYAGVRGADVGDIVDDIRGEVEGDFDGARLTLDVVPVGGAVVVPRLDADVLGSHEIVGATGVVTVHVQGTDGFDPEIQVLDADGTVLGEDDDGGSGLDSRLVVDLAGREGARILVHEVGGDAGGYRLLVLEGEGPSATGPPLTLDAPTGGDIAGGDDGVAHTFVGTGGPVAITASGFSSTDPIITVLDASGATLARNDDFGPATGRDARVEFTIPAGAEVTVRVTGFGSSAGPYVLVAEATG